MRRAAACKAAGTAPKRSEVKRAKRGDCRSEAEPVAARPEPKAKGHAQRIIIIIIKKFKAFINSGASFEVKKGMCIKMHCVKTKAG
jgi:hypothetical protein